MTTQQRQMKSKKKSTSLLQLSKMLKADTQKSSNNCQNFLSLSKQLSVAKSDQSSTIQEKKLKRLNNGSTIPFKRSMPSPNFQNLNWQLKKFRKFLNHWRKKSRNAKQNNWERKSKNKDNTIRDRDNSPCTIPSQVPTETTIHQEGAELQVSTHTAQDFSQISEDFSDWCA